MASCRFAVITAVAIATAQPSLANAADTFNWQFTPAVPQGFFIGHPPSWTVRETLPGHLEIEAPRELTPGARVSCRAQAFPQADPRLVSMLQADIDRESAHRPVAIAALQSAYDRANLALQVTSSFIANMAGRPAPAHEWIWQIPHRDGHIFLRGMRTTVDTPSRRFQADCTASAETPADRDRLYIEWGSTFRAFTELVTVFQLPRR